MHGEPVARDERFRATGIPGGGLSEGVTRTVRGQGRDGFALPRPWRGSVSRYVARTT